MTRKKVKLVWIASDSARKASLKKRRVGLLKKVSELTTLCGVNAFVIIYSPEDNEPAVWPSRPVVQQLLARFQSMPEMERSKKMMNQETYLKEREAKVQDQHKKLHRRNKEVEMAHLMFQIYQGKSLDEFLSGELHGLVWLVEEKMKEIRKRIDYFQQVHLPPGSHPPQNPMPGDDMGRIGGSGGDAKTPTDSLMWDQWFMDVINNNENVGGSSSVRGDIGLPHNTYVGSSSGANDMGLPHGTFRSYTGGSDMGLPHGTFRGHPGGSDMGLSHGTFRGQPVGSDLGLPHGTFRGYTGASDLGLPHGTFRGPTGASDMGLPHGTLRGHTGASDMRLPHGNTGGSSTGYAVGLGLHPQGKFGGGNNGNDTGLELQPHGTAGGSTGGSEVGLPFGLFGGSSGGSDIGLPYDVSKTNWPTNFSP